MGRTPLDFVEDLLSKGYDWVGILSVARQVRNGAWYKPVREILQERGKMPTDQDEINRVTESIGRKRAAFVADRSSRKKRRGRPKKLPSQQGTLPKPLS